MTTLDSSVDADLKALINSVVQAHDCREDGVLWKQLVELGLGDLTGDELRGGSGATWREAAYLIRALARSGCALEVGDSDIVAGWLLDQAGIVAPEGLRGVQFVVDNEATTAALPDHVDRVVIGRQEREVWRVADIAVGTPVGDTERTSWHEVSDDVIVRAQLHRSLVRAVQLTGVFEAITDLTVEHAKTREQFGKPIGRQQAVQRMVTVVAGETALARVATDAAVLAAAEPDVDLQRLAAMVAVARSCAGHAVDQVIRNAHQVIGAIGTTREHRLHIFTTAALSTRHENGATRDWDAAVLRHTRAGHALSDLDFSPVHTER